MTMTRRALIQNLGISAVALSPVFAPKAASSRPATKGQTIHYVTKPPRVKTASSMEHPPVHHSPVHKHLPRHHKYAHHKKHPRHKAHSLRAQHTLDTPGNRHDLALTMWGEARGYGELGMRCIGHVIMNRVVADEHALGHGIHGVCHKRKQFSCWNGGTDPNLARMKELPHLDESNPDWIAFVKADRLAGRILAGIDKDNTGGATYYHAEGMTPYWRGDMDPVGVMFGHIFYKRKHHRSHNKTHHRSTTHH